MRDADRQWLDPRLSRMLIPGSAALVTCDGAVRSGEVGTNGQ